MRLLDDLLARPTSEHWRFPIAFAAAGDRIYALSDVVQLRPAITAPARLSDNQWRELALARMRAHSVYQHGSPAGLVRTPAEAIRAIESNSAVGEQIVADQRELVTRLLNEIAESDGSPTSAA